MAFDYPYIEDTADTISLKSSTRANIDGAAQSSKTVDAPSLKPESLPSQSDFKYESSSLLSQESAPIVQQSN